MGGRVVVRVAFAVAAFALQRDRVYVMVTLIVLGVLLTASWAEEGDLLGIEQRKLRIFLLNMGQDQVGCRLGIKCHSKPNNSAQCHAERCEARVFAYRRACPSLRVTKKLCKRFS